MENYHLPFKTGMDWLRGACVVVKRAPATVFGILGCYVLALFVANLPSELLGLSWLGAILSSLVTPFGALAFAACGRELARGCPPTVFSCFGEGWNDMETRNKLVLLGLIYGLCVIVIGLIVSLLTSGDIAQWKNAQGQIDPQSVLSHIPWLGFIVGAVLYAMLLGITCFLPAKNNPSAKLSSLASWFASETSVRLSASACCSSCWLPAAQLPSAL